VERRKQAKGPGRRSKAAGGGFCPSVAHRLPKDKILRCRMNVHKCSEPNISGTPNSFGRTRLKEEISPARDAERGRWLGLFGWSLSLIIQFFAF